MRSNWRVKGTRQRVARDQGDGLSCLHLEGT